MTVNPSNSRLKDKLNVYKNLLGICLSFILSYASFIGIVTIQSSINATNGLGLISSAIIFTVKMITVPLMPSFTKLLGSKYSLCIGYSLLLVYITVNYYPEWYTLIPGAVFAGLADGPMWVSLQVHTVHTATNYANITHHKPEYLIAMFTGIFALAIKIAQILGSLLSSAILFNYEGTSDGSGYFIPFNETISSCNNTESSYVEQDILYYVLIGVYNGCAILGLVVALLFLDHYPGDRTFSSMSTFWDNHFLKPFKQLLLMFVNWKMILLLPLMIINGMALTFMIGHYTSVYISECIGLQWIGIIYAIFSLTSGLMSLIIGRIYKYIPTYFIVYSAAILSCGLLVFIFLWGRQPNVVIILAFAVGWAWIDAMWSIGTTSIGLLFHDVKEVAFSFFQICLALGFVISFVLPLFASAQAHVSVITGLLILSSFTITILLKKSNKQIEPSVADVNTSTSVEHSSSHVDSNKLQQVQAVNVLTEANIS